MIGDIPGLIRNIAFAMVVVGVGVGAFLFFAGLLGEDSAWGAVLPAALLMAGTFQLLRCLFEGEAKDKGE